MQFVSFSNRPVTPSTLQNGLFLFDSGTNVDSIKTVDDWFKQAFNCFGLTMVAANSYVQSGPVRALNAPVVLHKIPTAGIQSGNRDFWQRWTLFEDSYAYGRGTSVSTSGSFTGGQIRYFLIPPTSTGQLYTGNFNTYRYEATDNIAYINVQSFDVNKLATMPSKYSYGGAEFGTYRAVSGKFYITCNNAWGMGAFSNFKFGPAAVTSISKDSSQVEYVNNSGVISPGSSYCTWMGAVRTRRRPIQGQPVDYEMLVFKRGVDYEDTTATGAGGTKRLDFDLKGVLGEKFFLDAPIVKL